MGPADDRPRRITLYSTCPSSNDRTAEQFRRQVRDVSRWSESHGCRGLLIYTDNTLVDPWSTAQFIIDGTEHLVPMVAVQPLYLHPFSVARMIGTIGHLYGRGVDLNLVTGGFAAHLRALGDGLDHDERYDRLVEYGGLVRSLLHAERPVTHQGEHYRLAAAATSPALPTHLLPEIFVSGSSPAALQAAAAMNASRLAYPHPIASYGEGGDTPAAALQGTGMRVGVIARPDSRDAWRIAGERFPSDTSGERLHDLAARMVESVWHQRLSDRARRSAEPVGPYWLYPFRTYATFCPYLVGSYAEVGELLARYFAYGVHTVILDVPATEEDLHHTRVALDHAAAVPAAG